MGIKLFQDPPVTNRLENDEGGISYEWEQWLQDLTSWQAQIIVFKAVLDPANKTAANTHEETFTITAVIDEDGNSISVGSRVIVEVGDIVLKVIKPTLTAGLSVIGGRIDAQNQVTVEFTNPTGGALNPGSETYTFVILKG